MDSMETFEKRPARRARSLRSFLYFIGLIALVIAAFYAEEDGRGRLSWKAFKNDWEARGENFNPANFVPPAVPNDKNFALTPIVYTTYGQILTRDGKVIPDDKRDPNFINSLDLKWGSLESDLTPTTNGIGDWAKGIFSDLKPWQDYYRDLAAMTNLFPVPTEPGSPAKDVLLALSVYESRHGGIETGESAAVFTISPDLWHREPSEHLPAASRGTERCCSMFLQMRAIAELQNGESQNALDDIKLMLRLTDSIRTEPF